MLAQVCADNVRGSSSSGSVVVCASACDCVQELLLRPHVSRGAEHEEEEEEEEEARAGGSGVACRSALAPWSTGHVAAAAAAEGAATGRVCLCFVTAATTEAKLQGRRD